MKQLHTIQLEILQKLLFAPSLRYGELKPNKNMENNQFQFHLDQLISGEFIEKEGRKYILTTKGKEYANTIDTTDTKVAKQAKISALIAASRTRNGKDEYLIYTRLKQPFYGCQGFMTGKIKYGEQVLASAQREFKEETNLNGKPQLVAIIHYRVLHPKANEVIEDKFMFFCVVKKPTGDLVASSEGKYEWVKEKDFKSYVTNHFESFEEFMNNVNVIKSYDGTVKFIESDYIGSKF